MSGHMPAVGEHSIKMKGHRKKRIGYASGMHSITSSPPPTERATDRPGRVTKLPALLTPSVSTSHATDCRNWLRAEWSLLKDFPEVPTWRSASIPPVMLWPLTTVDGGVIGCLKHTSKSLGVSKAIFSGVGSPTGGDLTSSLLWARIMRYSIGKKSPTRPIV